MQQQHPSPLSLPVNIVDYLLQLRMYLEYNCIGNADSKIDVKDRRCYGLVDISIAISSSAAVRWKRTSSLDQG